MRTPQTDSLQTHPADSLQLQQADLDALYEPPPVNFTFETIGWEAAGVLLLVLVAISLVYWLKRYIRNSYRREALKQLKYYQSHPANAQEVLTVLKKSAMHAYGRQHTGNLYGHEWLKFLDHSGKNVHLLDLEKDIAAAVYQEQPLSAEAGHSLLVNAKNWINSHAGKP